MAADTPIAPRDVTVQGAGMDATLLLAEGLYVIGFFYPVVAKGLARIRVQLSAAHSQEHLDKAINAFIEVGKELEVIK